MTDEIHLYDSPKEGEGKQKSSFATFLFWLISSITSVIVLGYFSAFIPGRLKLLGFFPCFLGLSSSLMILYWRNMWSYSGTKFLLPLSFLLAITCFGISTYFSYQKYNAILTKQFNTQKSQQISMKKKNTKSLTPEEEKVDREIRQSFRDMFESEKQNLQERSSFGAYLGHRVSSLGNWSKPWPEIFWGIEFLLAGLFSSLFTRRFFEKRVSFTSPDE
jgi:hypothetical protein